MWKKQVWQNIARVALGLGAVSLLGVYGYIQYQNISDLQQQITQLPDGKDKVALVKDEITLKNTIAGTVIQSIGGLLVFITVWVSLENLKATQKNVEVAAEKQVTERFTQAINQLGTEGDDKVTIRLGGIYALERIARDSEKDHWAIMEVLTSFVQEKSPLKDSEQAENQPLTKIAKDAQAALTVIGRRESRPSLEPEELDLSEAYLVRANLVKAHLNKARLVAANLIEADLSGAHLEEADLHCAKLNEAHLTNVKLIGADLRGANLIGAYLMNAELCGAKLDMADLRGAKLNRANLKGVLGLTKEQLQNTYGWEEADYDEDFRQQLGLPPEQKS